MNYRINMRKNELSKLLIKAIYAGISESLDLDDDNNDINEVPSFQKDNSYIKKSSDRHLALAQFKAFGIETLCNYEFQCSNFIDLFNNTETLDNLRTNLTSEGYFEIHFRGGLLADIRINFSKIVEFYSFELYNKNNMQQFHEQYPYCSEVANHMKPDIVYVSPDKALAILDNRSYFTIMPTFSASFPRDIEQYDNSYMINNIDKKDPLVKALKSVNISVETLLKYHFIPKKDDNNNLQFSIKMIPAWLKYFKLADFEYDIMTNKKLDVDDTRYYIDVHGKTNPNLQIYIEHKNEETSAIIKLND